MQQGCVKLFPITLIYLFLNKGRSFVHCVPQHRIEDLYLSVQSLLAFNEEKHLLHCCLSPTMYPEGFGSCCQEFLEGAGV